MTTANKRNSSKADTTGIASALLCTIHCLAIPALLFIKTAYAGIANIQFPAWWHSLDYMFLLISFYAVFHSASHTSYAGIRISLWAFWTILAISILFEASLYALAYVASAGLIITHIINLRLLTRSKHTAITTHKKIPAKPGSIYQEQL